MRTEKLTCLLAFALCLSGISCGQTHAFNPVSRPALIEAVRQYGQNKQPSQGPTVKQSMDKGTAYSIGADDEASYQSEMAASLVEKNFSQLEKEAQDARNAKTRFAGGVWKLYAFYDGVSEPAVKDNTTDGDWNYHIGLLREWASARPESVTARLALADTYQKFAEKGRGAGYANTVSDSAWKLYNERNEQAASILVDAARLKEKCPFWYEAMQQLAISQGWDKSQARELFDQASAFAPDYYHFYREYAYYLLPKWQGEPGDAEAFAEEVSNRVGGPEGKFIYFEIASLLTCQCDSTDSDMEHLSWPKIKAGYEALGQLYGYSNVKINRFAHMAVEADDKPAAKAAFAMIGDDWDHSVWHSIQKFESARNWAASR